MGTDEQLSAMEASNLQLEQDVQRIYDHPLCRLLRGNLRLHARRAHRKPKWMDEWVAGLRNEISNEVSQSVSEAPNQDDIRRFVADLRSELTDAEKVLEDESSAVTRSVQFRPQIDADTSLSGHGPHPDGPPIEQQC